MSKADTQDEGSTFLGQEESAIFSKLNGLCVIHKGAAYMKE